MPAPSEKWQRLETLFHAAAELPVAARGEFLKNQCRGDPELQQEVETLLASAEAPMDFLEKPIAEAAGQMVANEAGGKARSLHPGSRFARYEILRRVGAGGMGEVYLAYDGQLKRNLALKLLAPPLTQNKRGLRRLEQEAQAASALNHPSILTIYEFGRVEGVHYIASEFVEGRTLRGKCSRMAHWN
jgi:serine/threonine-protein kinase